MNNRTRKLGYGNLNWPRCSARVTESLVLTDGSFCQKQNTLYFRLCKNCEFMMCIFIVNPQFNRIHPWCSWECMLPGRCSPGKRCHTFWNRNIVLLPIRLGKVSCIPKSTLCELYGVLKSKSDKVRQTVALRFSWECVLSHTWISPWTQKGILLCRLDPRKRSVTYVVMDDDTSV